MRNINTFIHEQRDGSLYTAAEFEFPTNTMAGEFAYEYLRMRLARIKKALDEETRAWARDGARLARIETQLACKLTFQFKQFAHKWNDGWYDSSRVELSLPYPKNPSRGGCHCMANP